MVGVSNRIGGVLFLATLCLTILAGDVILIFPMLPLLWISPYLCAFRWLIKSVLFGAASVASSLHVFGMKFTFSGDAPLNPNEHAILLSNHPSRLDWMFLWTFTDRLGTLAREKIFLKSNLKSAPLAGWAMQSFCFIFLRRKWEDDEPYITRSIKHLLSYGLPYQYLLFAEGTDLSPSNRDLDDTFATQRGLTIYKHLLHPRTRGFEHLTELLHAHAPPNNAAIYDITLAYDGFDEYLTEAHLARGRLPQSVHLHLQRYDLSSVPSGAAAGEWLKKCWDEKEKKLAAFYAGKPFTFSKEITPLAAQFAQNNAKYNAWQLGTMLFWFEVVALFMYLFFTTRWFKIYTVIAFASLAIVSRVNGGLEVLEQKVASRR